MKKVIAAIAVVGALASCQEQKKEVSAPATYMDSVSYAMGMMTSKNFSDFKDSLNTELVVQGFENQVDSAAIFNDSTFTALIQGFGQKLQAVAQKKQMEEQQVIMEKHNAFMKEVESYDGVVKTESGLCYKVVSPGAGAKPTSATDVVKVNYVGKFIDGKVFDQNDGIEFPLNGVIRGWTEGIQLMSIGSTYEFYIPFNLAYGPRGNQGIPPFSALHFTVELLEVKPGKEKK